MKQDLLAPWVLQALEEIATKAPYGDGRVSIGLAFDGFWLPKEIIVPFFDKAKSLGIKVITTHCLGGPTGDGQSIAATLDAYGLLDSSILLSHVIKVPISDVALIKAANAHISSTPSTELQMMGTPMAFSPTHDFQSHASLGIDCHSATSGSMVSEMRLLLQSARGVHNTSISDAGKIPWHINKTVGETFNLATISGARAIGEEANIGSLAEGKLADIVIFDSLSPAMVGAAQQDPVAAVVLHSSPADIDMLIVDGVVRKDNGELRSVEIVADDAKWAGNRSSLKWADVAKEIIMRRKVIAEKLAKIDMVNAQEGAMKAFHYNRDLLADSV
ncbi:hypothetical protein B0A49_12348 [Cryomyces minteri]|uniref:Amidohydrolase-related domain-containing protein n=1 Tax=Cryomyces minteri TaxID=331657 RepID=A0A4U0WYM2_9PEZI|nr:hypothetical protein B0A49_12348 [Cryomyces minteri]